MAPLIEFYASIADVTNEQHQNMEGLVRPDDFNAEVVVRFLRANGINACVSETTGGCVGTIAAPNEPASQRGRHARRSSGGADPRPPPAGQCLRAPVDTRVYLKRSLQVW